MLLLRLLGLPLRETYRGAYLLANRADSRAVFATPAIASTGFGLVRGGESDSLEKVGCR